MVVRALVTLLFLLPALAGCDGGADPEPDVDAIVASVEEVPSVTKSVRLTEDTYPDKMPGREDSLHEAAVFYDSRLKCSKPVVDCGAVLEVWAEADDAKARSEYLEAFVAGQQWLGSEYHYRDGALLLRVNGDLTAKQAEEYQAAFNEAA